MKPFLLIIFAALLASGSVPASADEPPAHVITPPESTAPAERPLRVGLVLSGGGARGFAHIGVLKVLEEAGVKVSVITATSMGSMVGGAYAEGYTPEEMANIVKNVNWTQMFAAKPNRADLNWRRKEDKEQGLSDTELGIGPKGFALPYGIVTTQELDLFLAKTNEPASMINDLAKLPIPFAAFATDLETGKAVELQKNISLSRAMRASMSIPGVYAPAEWQGKLLVDGGLVQNLPVDAARAMGADIIIAVNVGTPLSPRKDLGSIAGVMGQMLNILTEQNVQKSLKELRKEDILITPDLSKYTSGDFTKSAEIMKVGEDAARKIFDQLKKLGVPQKEFAAWNAKRHELIETDKPHQLADIRVDGLKTVNPKSVLAEIKIRPGDTVTTSQVEAADKKIWQDDDFLSVPYRFEPGPDGMEVLVFEPLWTVIPGNKAILPILWSLFPHHRYLLDTDFTVNDELVKTGYAVKPIAGRCGSNIDLVSHHEEVLDKTSGKFAEQRNIYQQLWCLPKVDGKYIQVCTFTVGGNYGGTCLRGDESLVIKKESDIEPLIVVKE